MSVTSISESKRRLNASSIYSRPLKPWETRVLRLEPLQDQHYGVEIVEVHLEIAVIPQLEGLGLVETGEVVCYEALSYTWDSNIFSHAVHCNGLDFSVTANLHAALVHLRSAHVHRWLWIDGLCINQYDNGEKERQVRNMFHIYRKASTVLVWLGPAGPNTSLGADIVKIYEGVWQQEPVRDFADSIKRTMGRKPYYDSGKSITVDEFLNDLQKERSFKDGESDFDTLGLLSKAWDGIVDLLGRAWLRRTWIIQEIAAALRVEFHCGPFVLSYDAFYEVMPIVGVMIWNTRNVYLAGEQDMWHEQRVYMRQKIYYLDDSDLLLEAPDDLPATFEESSTFFKLLHELRRLVNDPIHHSTSRYTNTELLLVFLVEAVSRGFEVSIAVDRVFSLTAMTDAISSSLWGLTHNERKASSSQQVPVDYSVDLRTAVLRALKIRMNEIRYFYVAINKLDSLGAGNIEESIDWATKSVLLPICAVEPSAPSWLKLLAFKSNCLSWYNSRSELQKYTKYPWKNLAWGKWDEQDVTEPDTLVLCGKALGRLVVDSEKHPSRAWMALPCPLGQEFERCEESTKPIRALHQGCPDEPPLAAIGERFDDAETAAERNDRSEPPRALSRADFDSELDWAKHTFRPNITKWSWHFPPSARDGDVVVVFVGTCALVRPLPGGKYQVVEDGLRVPVDCSYLDQRPESTFISKHCEDLDSFILA